MKKSLVAISVLVILGVGGYAGTAVYIKQNAQARLEKMVDRTNEVLESSALRFSTFVPKFVLSDVKSNFTETTFKLELVIDNPQKQLFSDPYEMEEVKFEDIPATLSLMRFDNTAKHGPFPNISRFDFTPVLMLIDTKGSVTQLPKQISTTLGDKPMVEGFTTISLSGGFSSKMTALENQLSVKTTRENEKKQIDFKGATFDISAGKALRDLQINLLIKPFELINELAENPAKSDDDFNFDTSFKEKVSVGELSLTLNGQGERVIYYLYPTLDSNVDFKGVTYHYTDDETTTDFTFAPISAKSHSSINGQKIDQVHNMDVGAISYQQNSLDAWSENASYIKAWSMSPFTLSLNIKDDVGGLLTYTEQYLAVTEEFNRKIRDLRLTVGNNDTAVGFASLEMLAGLYGAMTNFTGISTTTISPLNLQYTETEKVETTTTQLTDKKFEFKPITSTYSRPTRDDKHVFDFKFEAIKYTDAVNNFNGVLENALLMVDASRKGIVPDVGVGLKFGLLKGDYKDVNLFTAKDYSQRSSVSETDKRFSYGEHYSLGNLNLLGLDFGSAEIKANLGNFDSQAMANLVKIMKDKYKTIGEDSGAFEAMASLGMTLLPEVKNLLSHGITFTLSPVQAQNSAGKASLDFDLKLKPLDPLALTLSAKDSQALFGNLVDSFVLNTSIDKKFIGDLASKIEALTLIDDPTEGVNFDQALMQQTADSTQMMLDMLVENEPFSVFVKNDQDRLGLTFEYKNQQFMLNGQPKTLEALMSAAEMLSGM